MGPLGFHGDPPFPAAVWSRPENAKPPALGPTPTHHPASAWFPRIHMVMKASIFPQTHTGPSDPPRPPAQWPPVP